MCLQSRLAQRVDQSTSRTTACHFVFPATVQVISQLQRQSPLTVVLGVLRREAKRSGLQEELRQLRRSPTPPFDEDGLENALDSPLPLRQRTASQSSSNGTPALKKLKQPYKEPPGFEVLRAVERKDIMFLMEVRWVAERVLFGRSF